MTDLASAALAITMIAAFLLIGVGAAQLRKAETRQRGLLMVACGIVFLGNVLIWTV